MTTVQLGLGWFPETPGGLERYYHGMLHRLPTVGIDAHGLVVGTSAVSTASARVSAGARKDAPLAARLREYAAATSSLIEDVKPDVVASHFALYTRPSLRALRRYPLVVHFQGPWAWEGRLEGSGRASTWFKQNLVERPVYQRARQLITLCEPFKAILCDRYGIDERKVTAIPGAISVADYDVSASRVEARETLGWPTDRPILLSVRRLVSRMGLEELVQAIDLLRRRRPDLLCLIAGRGRLSETIASRIRSLGLDDHVRLLGFVPDDRLPLAYRAADLTIVPSLALEGFGLVAAESLAAGTPALVAPVGGLPQIVRTLSPELVLRDVAAPTLSATVGAFLNGECALPSSDACRAHSMKFDWATVLPQIKNVYSKAAAGGVE